MREIVDWWKEYGIRNWETDDNRILFDELLRKIYDLPARDEKRYILDYLIDSGSEVTHVNSNSESPIPR
jgi:nuclear transport factor 2 (NTF2) superfamily protein